MKLEDWPTRIRHLIPPGFDLDAYKGAERYTIGDWLAEMLYRTEVLSRFLEKSDKPDAPRIVPDQYFGLWKEYVDKKAKDQGLKQVSLYPAVLCDLSIGDAYEIYKSLFSDQYFSAINQRIAERFNSDGVPQSRSDDGKTFKGVDFEEIYSKRYKTRPYAYLMIDLNAPKKTLIEKFNEWINDAKQNVDELKMKLDGRLQTEITPARLQRIADNRVLAYIDLVNWHKKNSNKIPSQRYLQEILFFNDERNYRDVSWFTKAVAEPAKWLQTPMALNMLFIQADKV